MAALDFPASPTVGQAFAAGNGVVYTWSGTLWLASGASAGGDFCATKQNIAISSSPWIANTLTILSGNSGGWLTSAGRYTPPAGRYVFYASMTVRSDSAANVMSMVLRQNGVNVAMGVPRAQETTIIQVNVGFTVALDANGTDYFELAAYTSAANGNIETLNFGAFPISGIKGPPGDTGAGGPPGEATTVLQTRMFQTGAAATGTTVMVYDDTIPQITEGTEFMTLAFTPLSATSKLIITVNAAFSHSATVAIIGALFRDSTANALASMYLTQPAGNQYNNLSFAHTMTSGTTSPINFRFRAGGNAPGTLIFNGQAGTRLFGGTMASSIVIQEVSP